jgi:hypothetical protein
LRMIIGSTPNGLCCEVKVVEQYAPTVNWPLAKSPEDSARSSDFKSTLALEPMCDLQEASPRFSVCKKPPCAIDPGPHNRCIHYSGAYPSERRGVASNLSGPRRLDNARLTIK